LRALTLLTLRVLAVRVLTLVALILLLLLWLLRLLLLLLLLDLNGIIENIVENGGIGRDQSLQDRVDMGIKILRGLEWLITALLPKLTMPRTSPFLLLSS
jgi:hypothetical protein